MEIMQLHISPLSTPPRGFSSYKMKAIYISQTALNRYKGTFSILYENGTKERKLYYKYLLEAKVSLYKSTRPIKRGEIIDYDNVSLQEGKFETIRFNPIDSSYFGKYIAKIDIQDGKIITTKDIKIIPDIKRSESVDARLYDHGIVVNFSVKAMEDGVIGDIIKVRKKHNRTFKAKIISKTSVEIIE